MEYEWGQDPSARDAFGRINFSSSKLLHRSMIFVILYLFGCNAVEI